jgi:hypothetical protein
MINVNNVNRIPEFTNVLPDTTIDNDSNLEFSYQATDPDEEPLSFGLKKIIRGINLTNSGELSWDIPEQPKEQYEISVFVTDSIDTVGTSAIVKVNDVVSIASEESIPDKFSLSQNYPNPFNPRTKIKYGLKKDCKVKISIYDINGNKVETILDDEKPAGYHQVSWNAGSVPTGVYFYKIRAGKFTDVKKCVLMK